MFKSHLLRLPPTTEEQTSRSDTSCLLSESLLRPSKRKAEPLRGFVSKRRVKSGNFKSNSSTLPKYLYSYKTSTCELYRTNLATEEDSCKFLGNFFFLEGCALTEIPGSNVLVTGGFAYLFPDAESEVMCLKTNHDFAVTYMAPMNSKRAFHGAIFHKGYVYTIGGTSRDVSLSKCERYNCNENRWDILEQLPVSCSNTSLVVLEATQALYALGGNKHEDEYWLRFIQKLDLENLSWDVIPLMLPNPACCIACFKVDESKAYFVIQGRLYEFNPRGSVKKVQDLEGDISSWSGPSYLNQSTIFASNDIGTSRKLKIKLNS